MEKNLYEQAILDAKAVRASAIANAKASLQEAFEPKIQEMLRMKLSEELEEDLEENYEEGATVEEGMPEEGVHEEGYEMTTEELDEILAELEAMEEGDTVEEDIEEGDYGHTEESLNEAEEEAPEGDEEPEGEEPPMEDDEMEVTIKFSDLKDVLAPFVTGAEEEGGEGEEGEGDEDAPEDTLSLDEILAELEEADMEEGKHEEDKKKMEEEKSVTGFGKGYKPAPNKGATNWQAVNELKKANKTIAVLSEKLQEINLLNAKLLYMNKIFKAKNLDESQKIKVVKSFDKASTVKEVKNVYEILGESLSGRKATPLRESRGFASKPAGVAPKTPIVDSDPTVDRWQQLVFGKK